MKSSLLFAALLAVAPAFAGQTKPAEKSDGSAARPVRTVRMVKIVRWQILADRPCDSTACRPVRFAWSPTAPGS